MTNVVGSTVAREADWVLHTWAGPEIAVASTKAYTTQVEALTLLAIWLGQQNGRIDPPRPRRWCRDSAGSPTRRNRCWRWSRR